MILPDHELQALGEQLIDPFKPENVQPSSIDLTLDDLFLIPQGVHAIDLGNIKDTAEPQSYDHIVASEWFSLNPRQFILGSTAESVRLPNRLVGRVEGKSSLGRLGLVIHSTAGYIDPGFEGKITLEFYNLNCRPIWLRPKLRVCQISFAYLASSARRPYGSEGLGSKYQGQQEATPSRYTG